MRRCQEVLARVGVHGASLTATVARIAEILPVERAHINPRILVPDTSPPQTWLYTPLFALPMTRPYATRPKRTRKHFTLGFLHLNSANPTPQYRMRTLPTYQRF